MRRSGVKRRCVLFVLLCLGSVALVLGSLWNTRSVEDPESFDTAAYQAPDFRKTVDALNAALEASWAELNLTPTPTADHLTIARRLSLGLTGVIPSLEEVWLSAFSTRLG